MSKFDEYMKEEAEHYVEGLRKAGLEPNDRLTRAMAERAYNRVQERCDNQLKGLYEQHRSNIDAILQEHRRDMNEIKRSGARLRVFTCPPVALMFGAVAWYNFNQAATHPEAWYIGVLFTFGAALFLAMLVGGAIFDRPEPEE